MLGWSQFVQKLVDMREWKKKIENALCDHNTIDSECHVIMSCPVYNELCGELLTHAAQFESHFNNLNNDGKFVLSFSTTNICFYTAKTCFDIFIVTRKMLHNTRQKILIYRCKTIFLLVNSYLNYCVYILSSFFYRIG